MARCTRSQVQAVPPRGHEALPEGRALPDREVRDRAPQLPAGRARPRPHQAVASTCSSSARSRRRAATTAFSRSSSATTTRRPRGVRASRARALLRMLETRLDNVALPPRLRGLARPGAPDHPPRPLPGERPPREHPELSGEAATTWSPAAGSPVEQVVRDATDLTASVAPWLQADHDNLTGKVLKLPERDGHRHARPGAAHRRALLRK